MAPASHAELQDRRRAAPPFRPREREGSLTINLRALVTSHLVRRQEFVSRRDLRACATDRARFIGSMRTERMYYIIYYTCQVLLLSTRDAAVYARRATNVPFG
jgi:hypothetical protein